MCVCVCCIILDKNGRNWNNLAVSHLILIIFCVDTQWVVPNFFVFGFGGVRGGEGGFGGVGG